MIRSFKHKGLEELYKTGQTSRIDSKMKKRILRRLDVLEVILSPKDMDLPGFNFHALRGHAPKRYSVHINGPWCVTFEWNAENAENVNYEQYH